MLHKRPAIQSYKQWAQTELVRVSPNGHDKRTLSIPQALGLSMKERLTQARTCSMLISHIFYKDGCSGEWRLVPLIHTIICLYIYTDSKDYTPWIKCQNGCLGECVGWTSPWQLHLAIRPTEPELHICVLPQFPELSLSIVWH